MAVKNLREVNDDDFVFFARQRAQRPVKGRFMANAPQCCLQEKVMEWWKIAYLPNSAYLKRLLMTMDEIRFILVSCIFRLD